ncbi:MAG: sulfatase, partial [Acidobacteria bacterium]|nr:sulfatase [Acidobacteriota bacterium]
MRKRAIVAAAVVAAVLAGVGAAHAQERPNILWLSSEDNGPALGAYGDAYADTPSLDRLAERGTVYLNAWSNAPVCAPARTAIITGMYPPAVGAHHMRSRVRLPDGVPMFPQLLRAAGYYATNNAKEDYNVEKPGRVWDESSNEAHWRNRPGHGTPGAAPFFAVFNLGITHESRIRQRPHEAVHDPAGVRVPAYHPDTPEVRQDWAQYYDRLTEMDAQVGERLAELEAAGLDGDTIVVYFGDHGVGLPRGKRSLLDSGLRVPLIVYVPPRFRELAGAGYRARASTAELVAFVDLAPTMLSLAGIPPPDHMHGRALLGPHRDPPAEYLYGFRGRMDERYDSVRAVRDGRYVYVRNYAPHRVYGQHVAYMFQTPTTRVWKALYD